MTRVRRDQRGDWLVVPSETHVEAAARAGVPARTLRRLIEDEARDELGGLAATTPEATRLLVGKLREVPAAHARALDQIVGTLRRAGTTAAALRGAGLARGKYFADLIDDLDAALAARSLYDDRSSPWAAARRLRATAHPGLGAGSAVVHGLTSWDNATLALLESLDERVRRDGFEGVSVELPLFDRGPLRDATDALATELEARWAERSVAPELRFREVPSLSPERVSVTEAHAAESEARAVTRIVLEAIARGTPLDRVAIVPVDLEESFLEPLRFELARAKIPFAEPRGRPAIASPRAHAAIELLRLARGPLARDALVDVMRVPELKLGAWFGEHRGAVGELLHEISELPLRVDRSGDDLTAELDSHLAELEREDPPASARLAPARAGLGRWLTELRALSAPGSRAALIRRALGLFEALGLLTVSPRALARALEPGRRGRADLLTALGHDAAGARALETALSRVSAAAHAVGVADDPVTLGGLLEEIELALEGVSPTGGAVRAGAVRIARPRDAAGLEFDLVVLCRASDRGLDSHGNADHLGRELEARLPPRERPLGKIAEQHFAWLGVAWALAGARKIAVTWSSHDANRQLGPSRLVRQLLESDVPRRSEPASPLVPGARPAHARLPLSDGARHRVATELTHIAFFSDPNAPADVYNGAAGSLAPFLRSTERPLAVTAIEKTLRCPFLGFTGSVLRAAFADPVEDAISARERGNLLHEALAVALEAVRPIWGLRSPRELEVLALDGARALLEQRGRSPLRRAGLESTLLDVASLLRFIFDEDSGFRFELAEQEFGAESGWSALELDGRRLRGRADRIDLSPDRRRLRVLDYKTRLPTYAEQERALQPALYARKAALELGAETVEFAYLALQRRSPQPRTVFQSTPDGDEIRAGIERTLLAIESFEAGLVPPRPAAVSYCVRCAARDICRRPLSAPESADP
jgi:RecB family exonuclease